MAVDLKLPLGIVRVVSAHAPTETPDNLPYQDFLRLLLNLRSPKVHFLIGLDGNCRLSHAQGAPLVGDHGSDTEVSTSAH
eukprot:6679009-Prorocentrum_lima.AAC.1